MAVGRCWALWQVHGTPSRKRVVLRGKDLELQIAFEGENVAFNQFRDTLVVPDNIAENDTESDTEVDPSESNEDEAGPPAGADGSPAEGQRGRGSPAESSSGDSQSACMSEHAFESDSSLVSYDSSW